MSKQVAPLSWKKKKKKNAFFLFFKLYSNLFKIRQLPAIFKKIKFWAQLHFTQSTRCGMFFSHIIRKLFSFSNDTLAPQRDVNFPSPLKNKKQKNPSSTSKTNSSCCWFYVLFVISHRIKTKHIHPQTNQVTNFLIHSRGFKHACDNET